MTAAERLEELRRELARATREPSSYSVAYEVRWLTEAIRETEAEIAAADLIMNGPSA